MACFCQSSTSNRYPSRILIHYYFVSYRIQEARLMPLVFLHCSLLNFWIWRVEETSSYLCDKRFTNLVGFDRLFSKFWIVFSRTIFPTKLLFYSSYNKLNINPLTWESKFAHLCHLIIRYIFCVFRKYKSK